MIALATLAVWACTMHVWWHKSLYRIGVRWERGFRLAGSNFILHYGPAWLYDGNCRQLVLSWNHRYYLSPHYYPPVGEYMHADRLGIVWSFKDYNGCVKFRLFSIGYHMSWDEVYK